MIYRRPAQDEPLSQGDIIDHCPLFGLTGEQPIDLAAEPTRWLARIIVVTQACDLAQANTARVVVAIAHAAQDLVDRGILKGATIRDRVRRHQVFGWYFLPEFQDAGLPEYIADLRNLHSTPKAVLEELIARGRRICRLETPYREHLGQHFANTYARIGLPEPYDTK
jgi:hypothetical protein